MYIGDTSDGSGLHNMVQEVVSNSVNEAVTGHVNRIDVILGRDGMCAVRDNGRGIPLEIHPRENISVAELIMTRLCAPGLIGSANALNGAGIAVVNALSKWLELRVWRNGKEHFMRFREGVIDTHLSIIGYSSGRRGTDITFIPCPDIFATIEFDFAELEKRFRELASSDSRTSLTLTDERGADRKELNIAL